MDLKQLIKEVLSTRKSGCGCGCNDGCTKAPILNENLAPRDILSEGLKYHIDNKKPLTEHVYRAGSSNYFNLWAEARTLYTRGILDFTGDDLEILTETNLGEFGIIYEIEIGDKVKASKEYGGLSGVVVDIRGSFIVVKTKEGNESYHESDLKVLNKEGKKVPLDFIFEENKLPFEYKGFQYSVEDTGGMVNDRGQKVWKVAIQDKNGNVETTTVRGSSDREGHYEAKKFIEDEVLPYYGLNEAKTKKKDPPLNKPKRGGSKAYYVYVRDPKTKKVKKVSFGSGGLKAKLNNPKAKKAFAARHNCKTKKDRTTPGYWSCNLPKYWKQLGGDKNYSGYW